MSKTLRRFTSGILACGLALSSAAADLPLRIFSQPGESIGASGEEAASAGKKGSTVDFDSLEKDTREDEYGEKIYNTNYGLHTDKTVSKAYDDGRTFDLDLESWYIGENPADVGMILDASGSMAWTTTNPEPIQDESGLLPKNTFLTDDQLNSILIPTNTDNSRISYTNYQYYIYEARSSVSEFVPLGYWDGSLITNTYDPIEELKSTWNNESNNRNLTGFYPFLSGAGIKNQVSDSGELSYVGTGNIGLGSDAFSTTDSDKSRALQIGKTKCGLKLDVSPTIKNDDSGDYCEFTIAFALKGTVSKNTDIFKISTSQGEKDFYIREKSGGSIAVRTSTTENKLDETKDNADGGPTSGTSSTVTNAYNFLTFVFYKDTDGNFHYKLYKNNTSTPLIDKSLGSYSTLFSGKNGTDTDVSIVIDPKETSPISVYLDEVYFFDSALTESDVKPLYTNAQTQNVQLTTETKTDRAVDSTGNVLATISEDLAKASDRAGWYYVNSHQVWDQLTDPEVATGKQFRGMQLDCTDTKKPDTTYYTAPNFATVPITATDEVKGIIASGNNDSISFEAKENCDAPVQFFIDDAGYLRCFFNSGGDSAVAEIEKFKKIVESPNGEDGYLKPYITEVRTQCSLVYKKNGDIKTQTLNKVLNYFIGGVQESSAKSKISAMRFSNNTLVMESYKEGSTTKYRTVEDFQENLKKLLLLDWTSKGSTYSQNLADDRGFGDNTASSYDNMYNYFLTGGTNTWVGLKAFADNMTASVKEDKHKKYLILFTDGRDTLESSDKDAGNVNQIIGEVRPEGSSITDSTQLASEWAKELKDDGYTIFCVMMASGAISKDMPTTEGDVSEYDKAVGFLKTIASENPASTSEDNKYYVYTADTEDNLKSAFTSILNQIKKPLTNYTIQDYIDPRFDLVDNDGNVLKLGAGGQITCNKTITTVSDTEYLEYTPKYISYGGGEISATTKSPAAKIYYDSKKDMYYLRWKVDSIGGGNSPFETKDTETYLKESQADDPDTKDVNEEQAGRWYSTITVKAKDDFIGGNAVLTNGNEAGMNLVFDSKNLYDEDGNLLSLEALRDILPGLSGTDQSQDRDTTSGTETDVASPSKGFPKTTETDVASPSKGFPKTTVNVRLLPLNTNDREDVIYLGEVIAPKRMLLDLENNYVTDTYYLEYLQRYAYRYNKEGDKPLIELLNEWLGIEDEDRENKTFSIPYMYLPQPEYNTDGTIKKDSAGGITQVNSAAGETNQQDILGVLTYTWVRESKGDTKVGDLRNPAIDPYIKENTGEVKYSLKVVYKPFTEGVSFTPDSKTHYLEKDPKFTVTDGNFAEDKNAVWTFDNRLEYNKALVTDTVYEWDKEYKPAPGKEQLETITDENKGIYGNARIDTKNNNIFDASADYYKNVVSGGVALELLVKAEDLKKSDCNVTEGATYTLTAKRTFDAEYSYGDPYTKIGNTGEKGLPDFAPQDYKLTFKVLDIPEVKAGEELVSVFAKLTKVEYKDKEGDLTEGDNQLPIGTYTFSMPKDGDLTVVEGETEKFTYMSADTDQSKYNKGYFDDEIFTVPTSDSGRNVSSYLIKCDSNENAEQKYIAPSTQTSAESVTYYLGTESNNTIGVTNKNSNDYYINDRLGIIMLSYGTMKLDVKKEVTGTNLKENLEADWKFQITLKSSNSADLLEEVDYTIKDSTGKIVSTGEKITFGELSSEDGISSRTSSSEIKLKGGQTLTLTGISESGVSYTVEELPISDQENANKEYYKDGDYTVKCASNSGVINPGANVTYINEFPHAELPSTGGTGTVKLIIIGAGLTVAALALLLINKKRR